MPGKVARWFLLALCVQFVVLGLVQAWRDSPTADESYDLAEGVSALVLHQARINPKPLLPQVLAAAPALAAHPVVPRGASWRAGDTEAYRSEFMRAQARAGKLRRVVFLARLVPLAEGLAVGALAYVLAASLFGPAAGVLAATLWLTLPLAVGFAHIDGADLPFAVATLLLSLALLRYIRGPTARAAVLVGLVCGLVLVVRLTAFVLVPIALAVVVFAQRRRVTERLVYAGAAAASAWVVVRVVYRVVSPFPSFHMPALQGSVAWWARAVLLVPWPREYAYGIRAQAPFAATPRPGYLLGHALQGATWWFWPGSVLVKVPATTLVVVLMGLLLWRGLGRRTIVEGAVVLGAPTVAITAFTMTQQPLGVRYLLPVIALAIVIGSPLARLVHRNLAARLGVALLVTAQLAFLWASVPRSLAWTAPPFRPGYRFADDSNLDWGQDLYRLADWGRRHPGTTVLYFGPMDPTLVFHNAHSAGFGIFASKSRLPSGWWAVSATLLDLQIGSNKGLAWLRAYCPVGIIGDSILLYRFQAPPDQRLVGPDKPASVCHTSFTHVKATLRANSPQAASAQLAISGGTLGPAVAPFP